MGVMDERSSRIFVGVCLLVLLWIGTYWVYEPGRPASSADVSFDPPEEPAPTITVDRPDPPEDDPADDDDPIDTADTNPTETLPIPEPAPGTRVIPPEFREYVVRSGDTLETIARDQLGRSSLWTAIAESNPLKDPRRLRVGQTIRIPLDPDNIQGRVVSDTEPGTSGDQDEPAEETWVEYTVKSGDSLTRIARSYYGSVRYADAIFDANRDRLDSPDAISVGQVLRLPPLGDAEE